MRSAIDQEFEGAAMSPDQERMLILGEILLSLMVEAPADPLSKQILEFLDEMLSDDGERALFNFSPRLNYDDKLLPLKPPR